LALFIFVLSAFTLVKQDSDKLRNVSGFHAISISGPFKVFIKVGNTESLRIEADNDIIKEIKTEVKNNTLQIKQKESWKLWKDYKKDINIHVTVKNLDDISVSGSSTLKIEDPLKNDKMTLLVSGSGNMSLSITAKEVGSTITGSGTMNLSGSASTSKIKLSGSGSFNGLNLKTNKTSVTISGSGDANVFSDEEVSATISGSGNVNYKGNAKSTNIKSSGSGKIKKIE
jgi:hypothetical protein